MTYEIELRPSTRKAIDQLPKQVFNRIGQKIDLLAEQPRPPHCVKLAGHEALYRVRVGAGGLFM